MSGTRQHVGPSGDQPGLVAAGSSAPSFKVTVTDSERSSSWPEGAPSLRMMVS